MSFIDLNFATMKLQLPVKIVFGAAAFAVPTLATASEVAEATQFTLTVCFLVS